MWVARRPLNRRAFDSALVIHKMPREICLALGADVLKSDTGVDNIMEALQNNLGPDASDAAYCDIIMFPGLRQSHLTLDEPRPVSSRLANARRRVCPMVGLSQRRLCPHCASTMRVLCRIKDQQSILRITSVLEPKKPVCKAYIRASSLAATDSLA